MVIVLGSAVIREGLIEEAVIVSLEHVHRSRAEPGCLSHAVHRDCENPQRLVFVEEWADLDSLQRHFRVPESSAFVQALKALAAEAPAMVIYEGERSGP